MDTSQERFSQAQFEAARMFVARMRAEAQGELFDFDDIGMSWVPMGDPVVAVSEGVMIRAGDFVRAALVMMWSMILETAEQQMEEPSVLVTRLGLALAQFEPDEEA